MWILGTTNCWWLTSIIVKSTPRPVVLTIESILDGDICLQDKCCMCKCLCDSCPKLLFVSQVYETNFVPILMFLLRKFRWEFFLLFAKVKFTPSPRPKTVVRQKWHFRYMIVAICTTCYRQVGNMIQGVPEKITS